MAKLKNLVLDQGTTFTEYIVHTNSNKTPIDITGYLARAQMRKSYNSANAITFTANVVSAANGNISLNLTAAQTANIKAGRYVYDVEIYGNANVTIDGFFIDETASNIIIVHRVVEGTVTVNPEVTK